VDLGNGHLGVGGSGSDVGDDGYGGRKREGAKSEYGQLQFFERKHAFFAPGGGVVEKDVSGELATLRL
jgi:hypothetical protein